MEADANQGSFLVIFVLGTQRDHFLIPFLHTEKFINYTLIMFLFTLLDNTCPCK